MALWPDCSLAGLFLSRLLVALGTWCSSATLPGFSQSLSSRTL